MRDLPQNWTQYFRSLPGCDQGNRNSTPHSQIWSPDTQNDEKIQFLLSNKNAIILAADSDKKIIALHSFKKLSNGLHPAAAADRIVCLVGGGRDVPVIHVVEGSLTAPCSGATPGVDELKACTTANDIRALELPAPDTDTDAATSNYRGSATFFAAPWLAQAVMEATTHDPHELIPIVMDAAIAFAFDKKHRGNRASATKAADSVGEFVQWAWLVGAGKITNVETCFSIETNMNIVAYSTQMESSCLGKQTMNWSTQDDEVLARLFTNATVDPTNLNGVYIVWVLRKYFPATRLERCQNAKQRGERLRLYRRKACEFLVSISICDEEAPGEGES